ncbi:MAG: MBL fold metallo-hydrolase [Phycisphaerales bacterium]
MRLTFYGAAGEVTGSCYLLETDRARVLIDFGLHQGEQEARNRRPPPLNAPALDAVILTHAHLDHSGLMPLLGPAGYAGRVHATPATIDLTRVLLYDSAKLQEADAERATRRGSADLPPIEPLYGLAEVDALLAMLSPLPYWEEREVAPGVAAKLVDAGHILGSASVELTVTEKGRRLKVVFSGDLGPRGAPLVRDPTELHETDVLILESTYGDRDHRSRAATIEELEGIAAGALGNRSKVLVPAFAIGRTQDLIYELGKLHRAGRFRSQVFVDSPMATEATALYARHHTLLDGETRSIINGGESPLRFPGLEFVKTAQESKRLNGIDGGAVVIAGSGMCTGGRIVHHLKHGLPKPETEVVIVGFQAEGTNGRRLVNGQKVINLMGEPVPVKARIHTLGGLSAHAGQSGLVAWAQNFNPRPRVFLTHGENKARAALAEKLKSLLGVDAAMPGYGEAVEL